MKQGYKKTVLFPHKTLFKLSLLWMFISTGVFLEADILKIGFFRVPPHAFTDSSGGQHGAAVEFIRPLALKMGFTDLILIEYPLARLLERLENDQIDAILFIGKTPDRETRFIFPPLAYHEVQSGLVLPRTTPLNKIHSVDDIKHLTIGTTLEGLLTDFMYSSELQLNPVSSTDAVAINLKKLSMGRIGAFYQPDTAILEFDVKAAGLEKQFVILSLPEKPSQIFTIFSKKSAPKLLPLYMKALRDTLAEGQTYEKVLSRFTRNYQP